MSNAASVTAALGGQVTLVTIVSSGPATLIADVLVQGTPIAVVASGPATPVMYGGGPAAFFSAIGAAGGTVSGPRQTLYTNMYNSLQSAGFLPMLSRLGILGAENPQSALVDMITCTTALVPVGVPTFTVNQGYVGGAGKYIDTGFDPSIGPATNFGVATLSTRAVGADTVLIGNVQISGAFGIYPWTTGAPGAVVANNSDSPFSSTIAPPNASIKGIYHSNRSGPGTRLLSINGIQVQSASQAASAPAPGKSLLLGAWRNTDNTTPYAFSTDNICLWFAGLQPFTTPQALSFANILNTYMTAIGSPMF